MIRSITINLTDRRVVLVNAHSVTVLKGDTLNFMETRIVAAISDLLHSYYHMGDCVPGAMEGLSDEEEEDNRVEDSGDEE